MSVLYISKYEKQNLISLEKMLDVYRKALPEAVQQGQNMVVKFNPDDLKLILTSLVYQRNVKLKSLTFSLTWKWGPVLVSGE